MSGLHVSPNKCEPAEVRGSGLRKVPGTNVAEPAQAELRACSAGRTDSTLQAKSSRNTQTP